MSSSWLGGAHKAGLVALSLVFWLGGPPRVAAPTAHAAEASPPESARTAIHRTRLDNGLRIVLNRDDALPTVAVSLSFARDEHAGGLEERAMWHVLQHLMLQRDADAVDPHATEGPRAASAPVEPAVEHFTTLCGSASLEAALARQAERLKSFDFDAAELARALGEVTAEVRPGGRVGPGDMGLARLRQLAWGGAPLRSARPEPSELQLELSELREFQRRRFTAEPAVLSVAGDFELLDTLRLIRQEFADLPEVAVADSKTGTDAPASPRGFPKGQVVSLEDPLATTPVLLMGWPIAPQRDTDHAALELAARVLGEGHTSRLAQLLISDEGSARSVAVWSDDHAGPGLFGIRVALSESADVGHVRRLIRAQLSALGRHGTTARELSKAKRQTFTALALDLDGNVRRSRELAQLELWWNDAEQANGDYARYDNVSGVQIARAVTRWLLDGERSEVTVKPVAKREGS